jgi:hypothetical protein
LNDLSGRLRGNPVIEAVRKNEYLNAAILSSYNILLLLIE